MKRLYEGKRRIRDIYIVMAAFIVTITAGCGRDLSGISIKTIARAPGIFPDYSGIVIPANIGPLNFLIMEKGTAFKVTVKGPGGPPIAVRSALSSIKFPAQSWRQLLIANRGQPLTFSVAVYNGNSWESYLPFVDTVAIEPIDPVLVYRRINICVSWMNMGIYQYDLEHEKETPIVDTKQLPGACMNCHRFRRNDPQSMCLQIRGGDFGTPMLLLAGDSVRAVTTKSALSGGKTGFTASHPTEEIIAFSMNNFTMLYHTAAHEVRDVFDRSSDLGIYFVKEHRVAGTPLIAARDRIETMPEWSPDGRMLYFCSAPVVPPADHKKVQCDLMRIGYDYGTGTWGTLDTVLTAVEAGGSITQPRFSPDGRFCMISVSEYSDFPVHQAASYIYILSMADKKLRKIDNPTGNCDAWHGWSLNGKWAVFSSKRMNGRFSRPHFCYVDENGMSRKPFVMPQSDPAFYRSLISVYTVPELLTGPVTVTPGEFIKALREFDKNATADATTSATWQKDGAKQSNEF